MAVKLDISKVYDRVEWNFLKQIMLKIGLPEQWVALAMETMQTVSYSFLLNGKWAHHTNPGDQTRLPSFPLSFPFMR